MEIMEGDREAMDTLPSMYIQREGDLNMYEVQQEAGAVKIWSFVHM